MLFKLSLQVPAHSDVIAPNAPGQEVGHGSAISLHTGYVFIYPTPGVPFKISMPPMIRAAIIKYTLPCKCVVRGTLSPLMTVLVWWWCQTRWCWEWALWLPLKSLCPLYILNLCCTWGRAVYIRPPPHIDHSPKSITISVSNDFPHITVVTILL